MTKWHKGKFPGIRFRYHNTRKHGVKYDHYFSANYQVAGVRKNIGFGWASEGWTEEKVFQKVCKYKENAKTGRGPTTPTEEQAEHQELKRQKEAEEEKQKKEDITLSDFFYSHYIPIAEKSKKQTSVSNEKGLFKNWIEKETGHLTFHKIKPFNMEKIKKNLLDAGKAPRSVQYVFAIFRQVWNQARIQDITTENPPTLKVKIPKVDNQRLRFLTQDEADLLLSNLKERSTQLHNMALLSLHTGMRAGEIFSLSWNNISMKTDTITIKDGKSGKTRYVYLTDDTRSMFQSIHDYQEGNQNQLVFPDRNGKKMVSISKSYERAVNDLGLNEGVTDPRDKVLFHSLRHTFASWHVQSGTDLYTVKELLGHSTIQLTERYSHLRPDGLRQAAKIFNRNGTED